MSAGRARRPYFDSRLKRGFDAIAAGSGLVLLSPLLALVALAVLGSMGRPVLYVQERVGRVGRSFPLLKFRTMTPDDGRGPRVTASGDARVTPLGRLLRRTKIDELPQLMNVLRGDMSLVGPRPELRRYVERYDTAQRRVLRARPGITDPASIVYHDEERRLAAVEPARREAVYIAEIVPEKLRLNLDYLERCGFWSDLGVIVATARALFGVRAR
jgi:lipopolysaccharide/colanic/teichoic acid biosynthesis glycosyltransferase